MDHSTEAALEDGERIIQALKGLERQVRAAGGCLDDVLTALGDEAKLDRIAQIVMEGRFQVTAPEEPQLDESRFQLRPERVRVQVTYRKYELNELVQIFGQVEQAGALSKFERIECCRGVGGADAEIELCFVEVASDIASVEPAIAYMNSLGLRPAAFEELVSYLREYTLDILRSDEPLVALGDHVVGDVNYDSDVPYARRVSERTFLKPWMAYSVGLPKGFLLLAVPR